MKTRYLELAGESGGRDVALLGDATIDGQAYGYFDDVPNRIWLGADGTVWESAGESHWSLLSDQTVPPAPSNGALVDAAASEANIGIRSRLRPAADTVSRWYRERRASR